MDNFEQNETHYVRCLKCSKILKCSRYDTNALLEHIRTDHPEIEIVENNHNNNSESPAQTKKPNDTTEKPEKTEKQKKPGKKPQKASSPTRAPSPSSKSDYEHAPDADGPVLIECSICNPSGESDSIYKQRRRPASASPPRTRHCEEGIKRRRFHSRIKYRTSIERWRPASGTLYCPKCGQTRRPLIRSHSERITNNSCAATCLLSCWPLCFLPFLIPNSNTEYLHCANCKNFLGLYDRTHNCIKPNREFVPHSDTESHKS